MRCSFVILFLIWFGGFCYSQSPLLKIVLEKNQVNKVFTFDSSNKKDGLYKIYITYLGKTHTSHKELKIITASTEWGPNHHTSGVIYLYDKSNSYFGEYSLGSAADLPQKFENNELIFNNRRKKDCDSSLTTTIDFSKEIPKEMFIKCKDKYGDIYSFKGSKN